MATRARGFATRAFAALFAIFVLAGSVDSSGTCDGAPRRRPYCTRWDREIGPIYPMTDAGRRAPLRMIDLDRDGDLLFKHRPIIFTPTFVLVEGGKEVGRMEGYTGDEFFWVRLSQLLAMLQQSAPKGASVQGGAVAIAERAQ